jgi:hypothetical protein
MHPYNNPQKGQGRDRKKRCTHRVGPQSLKKETVIRTLAKGISGSLSVQLNPYH